MFLVRLQGEIWTWSLLGVCSGARSSERCPWKNLNAALIWTVGLMSHNKHNSKGNLLHPIYHFKHMSEELRRIIDNGAHVTKA